jgi:hypothetical protein
MRTLEPAMKLSNNAEKKTGLAVPSSPSPSAPSSEEDKQKELKECLVCGS